MFNSLEDNVGFFKKLHLQFCNSLKENDINDFSSLTTSEDKFLFVYNNPVVRSEQISRSVSDKNLEVAKQLKADGNKAFQASDYLTALFKYSKSVIRCPQDNEESLQELSIIFANRSAVFYHISEHHHALEDIHTSLELGYPASLHFKIHDRKARCLLALKQHKSAIEAFRKTLTSLDDAKLPLEKRQKWQKDVQIMLAMLSKTSTVKDEPFKESGNTVPKVHGKQSKEHSAVSDFVTFKQSENLGRYAEARDTIKAGEVIVVEKPHCSALLSERAQTHCFQCFTRLIASYPCLKCSNVAFCSKKCQKIAMTTHHSVECSILPTIWASGMSITCHMALRMFTQKNLDYFNNIKTSLIKGNVQLEKNNFNYTDYRSVYYLERNENQRTVEDYLHRTLMAVFLFKCLKTTGYFQNSEYGNENNRTKSQLSSDELYIGSLLLHNLQFLQFNAHEVSELELKNNDIDKTTSLFIGGAIYPTLSLFNHSCNPAIVRYFLGNTVIGRAIRTTYSGEMVAENYGPNFTLTPRAERQETLKKQYWFDCNCIACEENWPLFEEMDDSKMRFRCETTGCRKVIIVPTDTMKFMALCPECNEHMNLLKGLKALQDTDSMFRVARSFMTEGDINKALAKFIELLKMLEETLAPPFRDFHLCQQAARTCMLALGNKYSVKMIN